MKGYSLTRRRCTAVGFVVFLLLALGGLFPLQGQEERLFRRQGRIFPRPQASRSSVPRARGPALARELPAASQAPRFSYSISHLTWTSPDESIRVTVRLFTPDGAADCPVVIFSHGLGSSPEQFDYLASAWAQQGIVTVMLHHPDSDKSQWIGRLRPVAELKGIYQRVWSGRDRALLMRFAIDRLCEMAGQEGTVGEQIDTSRIGVAGNDLGALAAMLLAGQLPPDNGVSLADPRVTAVAAFSPTVFCAPDRGAVVYGGIDVPFISFAGTEDNGIVGDTKASERRIPFDSIQQDVCRYHVTLLGGDHMVYAGHIRAAKRDLDAMYQGVLRDLSTLFWKTFLLADTYASVQLNHGTLILPASVATLERKVVVSEHPSTAP
ncbi:MAG: hypothetical protein IIZ25_06820 [Thermoguttaceae bacterium]|nr:hypothetical protein [Thermoguttaceae bacterium]